MFAIPEWVLRDTDMTFYLYKGSNNIWVFFIPRQRNDKSNLLLPVCYLFNDSIASISLKQQNTLKHLLVPLQM